MKNYTNRKQFVFVIGLAFLACVFLLPVRAEAAEAGKIYTCGSLYYQVEGESVMITGCFGKESEIEVPDFIAGMPVNTIAAGAFTENDSLETVILPDTITEVEEGAFASGIDVIFGGQAADVGAGSDDLEDNMDEESDFVEKYAYLDEEAADDSGNGDSDRKNSDSGNSENGTSGQKSTGSSTGNSAAASEKSGNNTAGSSKNGGSGSSVNTADGTGQTVRTLANTGDRNHPEFYILAAAVSAAVLFFGIMMRRKKKE